MLDYQLLINNLVDALKPLADDKDLYRYVFEKCLDHALSIPDMNGSGTCHGEETPAVRDGGKKAQRTAGKSPRSKYNMEYVRNNVQSLEVHGDTKDLKPINKLSTKSDKCLWLLALANEHGIDGLTCHEISYLMIHKVRDSVLAKHITAQLEVARKDGRVISDSINRSTGFKIMAEGIAYCKA